MTTKNPKADVFTSFVPSDSNMAEFSFKAVALGIIFGLIFGAATIYLALRAGLTVSASIPIAVLSIAVFKRFGKSTILENNIVQTVGSAGESVAAGVAFTFPALIFLVGGEAFFTYFNMMTLAFVGGILGVLFMVPLRRALIVKEHETLPYPEGTACADVLIAGERGGEMAKHIFSAVGIAFIYKSLMSILGLWKEVPSYVSSRLSAYPNASIAGEITPEYLGVGYIIGPKSSGVLVAGGVLSYLVMIPLISFFGDGLSTILKPGLDPLLLKGTGKLIAHMSPSEIREGYVRYIGAGAVAAGGLITLIRTLPTIVSAFRDSFRSLSIRTGSVVSRRTDRDLPITFVIFGAVALILIMSVLPQLPGSFSGKLLMGLLVVVFGFFFVTVSARVVGIIGASNNPVSGMTIATLMATCLIFVSLGWTSDIYQSLALMVGGIVCIAAANAGATSQDLKTGYIVGGTPFYQQIGLVIGVLAATVAIGWTLMTIDNSMAFQGIPHAIGSEQYAAPQAALMATIIQGLLAQDLPWALVYIGFAIALVVELCGVSSLSFAVGAYLPLSTTLPIFVGGMLKWVVDKVRETKEESEVSPGMLFSTGLVAGGSLTGVVIAVLSGIPILAMVHGEMKPVALIEFIQDTVGIRGFGHLGAWSDVIGTMMFALLGVMLLRTALKKTQRS